MELEQLERVERHIRSLEAAYERERQQRDLVEKKYARLKRRFARLERSHHKLLEESQAAGSVHVHGVSSSRSPEVPSSLIDPTSPAVDASPLDDTHTRRIGRAISSGRGSRLMAGRSLLDDDICAESPSSPDQSEERPLRFARTDSMQSATSRSRRQLDFIWDRAPSTPANHPPIRESVSPSVPTPSPQITRPPPRREGLQTLASDWHSSPVHTTTDRRTSPVRPRDASSLLRTRSRSPESNQTAERTSLPAWSRLTTETRRRSPSPLRGRSISSSSSTAPVSSSPSPPASPRRTVDDDEAASLALAQYLQEQENIAAYEEYENRLRQVREQFPVQEERWASSAAFGAAYSSDHAHSHQTNYIDPDNMTYEELLQLGEQVGDVKKERWRQMAPQIISRLPTHRWSGDNQADVSCIICQYSFAHNDMALTLPCAHVFHEGCVEGWIRENNSCPLCKLEIAST